jgi:NADH:ubiquinone oxidoreductase subunit K
MTLGLCLGLAFGLFSIGAYGAMTRRHIVGMLISVEIMLNAANINFVAFSHFRPGDNTAGPIFTAFVIAVAACEMAVALAIVVSMYRRHKNLDIDKLRDLHG